MPEGSEPKEYRMIFAGFVCITGLLLLSAHFGGNISYFCNYDSIILVLLPGLLFSIGTFKWKEYRNGIRSAFVFTLKLIKRDNKTAAHFKSLIMITMAFGILSTAQGLCAYVLYKRDYAKGLIEPSAFSLDTTLAEAFVYAGFTGVYALLISAFLFYPICLINKEA